MREIVVFFKGAAAVHLSNEDYEVLTNGDQSEVHEVELLIGRRVKCGAVEDLSIKPLSYIGMDSGLGEIRF